MQRALDPHGEGLQGSNISVGTATKSKQNIINNQYNKYCTCKYEKNSHKNVNPIRFFANLGKYVPVHTGS